MSANSKLCAAITPIVPECVLNLYKGDAEEYCVFNVQEIPGDFADDDAGAVRDV